MVKILQMAFWFLKYIFLNENHYILIEVALMFSTFHDDEIPLKLFTHYQPFVFALKINQFLYKEDRKSGVFFLSYSLSMLLSLFCT